MSAEEEAKDLFDSYYYCLMQSDLTKRNYWAKQCALVAVARIMKQCYEYRDIDLEKSYDYWKEVELILENYE